MNKSNSNFKYRPEIDGLRALSVIAVIIYHFNPSSLPGGYLGVDVFFVISGYLITSLLIKELEENGNISLSNFYYRRAKRILPSLILVIFITSVFSYFIFFPRELVNYSYSSISSLFFSSNIYFDFIKNDY